MQNRAKNQKGKDGTWRGGRLQSLPARTFKANDTAFRWHPRDYLGWEEELGLFVSAIEERNRAERIEFAIQNRIRKERDSKPAFQIFNPGSPPLSFLFRIFRVCQYGWFASPASDQYASTFAVKILVSGFQLQVFSLCPQCPAFAFSAIFAVKNSRPSRNSRHCSVLGVS